MFRRKAIQILVNYNGDPDTREVWVHGFFQYKDEEKSMPMVILEDRKTGELTAVSITRTTIVFKEWEGE